MIGWLLKRSNQELIAVDVGFGSAALVAPESTLRLFGQESASEDAVHLFRNIGALWLTFAAAHAVAAVRGREEDWWALAWLRSIEVAMNVVWATSPAVSRPGARKWLLLLSGYNVLVAVGFASVARGRVRIGSES